MPPRYAYWTIIVDEQATAFRAGAQEDLMPTFNRLKEKHPSAKMMWFQNGKLWPSRIDAQEAMRARGELGRRGDERQAGGFRDRRRSLGPQDPKTLRPSSSDRRERPEWKPKGTFVPETRDRFRDSKPSSHSGQGKPEWRPKGASSGRPARPEWRPKGKLEWSPKTSRPQDPRTFEKRKWVPKEEYKKSLGIEAKKDKNWRPGGEHKDPRQKYKDAKKAKWTRFKTAIRTRSTKKKS